MSISADFVPRSVPSQKFHTFWFSKWTGSSCAIVTFSVSKIYSEPVGTNTSVVQSAPSSALGNSGFPWCPSAGSIIHLVGAECNLRSAPWEWCGTEALRSAPPSRTAPAPLRSDSIQLRQDGKFRSAPGHQGKPPSPRALLSADCTTEVTVPWY